MRDNSHLDEMCKIQLLYLLSYGNYELVRNLKFECSSPSQSAKKGKTVEMVSIKNSLPIGISAFLDAQPGYLPQ